MKLLETICMFVEENCGRHYATNWNYQKSVEEEERHMTWLQENLPPEAWEHLQKAKDAQLSAAVLEREALIRTALSVGIQLATL